MSVFNTSIVQENIGSAARVVPAGRIRRLTGMYGSLGVVQGLQAVEQLEDLGVDIATIDDEIVGDGNPFAAKIELGEGKIQLAPYANFRFSNQKGKEGYGAVVINAAPDNGVGAELAKHCAESWLASLTGSKIQLADRPIALVSGSVDTKTARTYTFKIEGGKVVGVRELKVGKRSVCAIGLTPDGGALIDNVGTGDTFGVLEMIPSALRSQLKTGRYGSAGAAFKMTGVGLPSRVQSFGQFVETSNGHALPINCSGHIVTGHVGNFRDEGTGRLGFHLGTLSHETINTKLDISSADNIAVSSINLAGLGAERSVSDVAMRLTVQRGRQILTGYGTPDQLAKTLDVNLAGLTTLAGAMIQV